MYKMQESECFGTYIDITTGTAISKKLEDDENQILEYGTSNIKLLFEYFH